MRRLIVISTVFIFAACANFQSIEQGSVEGATNTPTTSNAGSSALLMQLDNAYSNYKGVPYQYGGTDSRGFDCSGFINAVYRDAFDKNLPRTTAKLAVAGTPIRRDQLKAGDIVFFKTSIKQLHAGIYTEEGYFIHASTSKGVIRSSLKNNYWHQRYLKARRIL